MFGHQGGSPRMSARFVTVSSGGRADSARRCVLKWRCRFSNSPWIRGAPQRQFSAPFAESDLDRVNRCAVVQDVASDGASLDVRLNQRRESFVAAPGCQMIALFVTGAPR
jgi:hypothetical protein